MFLYVVDDTIILSDGNMSDVEILSVTQAIERGLTEDDAIVVKDYSTDNFA